MDRRHFLTGLVSAGCLMMQPAWLSAAAPARHRRLVLLHLNGGNDGLNTLVPYADRRYAGLRPTLALSPSSVLKLDGGLGLHPSLSGLKKLFDRGHACVIPGVGYPNPNLSHFRSTEIWYAATEESTATGWLGRHLERSSGTEFRSVAMGRSVPLSLTGRHGVPLTVGDFQRFTLPPEMDGVSELYRSSGDGVALRGAQALKTASRLSRLRLGARPAGSAVARDLGRALALLEADLGVTCLQITMDGFDTHVNQSEPHRKLLQELGDALLAWQDALESSGLADDVLTLVFSEFGRRPQENAGGGTDHGTAGPVLLIGRRVRAGICGRQPSLEALQDGNMVHSVDFRSVYAALLRDWFGAAPEPIVGSFEPIRCIV